MKVIKRNGSEQYFNSDKILNAIDRCFRECYGEPVGEDGFDLVTPIVIRCELLNRQVHVEEIQDMVEDELMQQGYLLAAKEYIRYRYLHELNRNAVDDKILSLIDCKNEEIKQENSNKNPVVASTQRDYMAGEVSKDITRRFLLPEHIWKAHEDGVIHFHDADYFAQTIFNCCLVNLEDMLQNGTVISGTMIEKPHSFSTACNIATQIIAQVASCQYGGQTITLSHLAPFVDVSRKKIRAEVEEELSGLYEYMPDDEYYDDGEMSYKFVTDATIDEIVEKRLKREIQKGVQTIQYQITTLMTTNGQAPFVTVFMYLDEVKDPQTKADLALIIEEVLRQRTQGTKNEKGVFVTPAFPKLIYVLDEDNVRPDSEYYYLTKLAAVCTAKRMVPDYISAKLMRELKIPAGKDTGDVYPCMGCRSFLTPDRSGNGFDNKSKSLNYNGQTKYYGRFNQGVVTINLVDVACSAEGDETKFWKLLHERLNLCYEALMIRHKRLLGTKSDISPIHFQYGALARLEKGESIDPLLFDGYSTISLGYAGLAECVWRMKGCSHTDAKGKDFGLKVMQALNDACAKWKAETNIDFSVYGTPIESTTYKFAKCLQRRFGIIPHVTDKNYITNSYHVHVTEPINAFEKLTLEAQFQNLSPGGAISYVEVPNMTNNINAVLALLNHIYDNIMYAELNTKSDYCQVCGYEGEIQIVEEDGKLVWECPNCGNKEQDKLNVARRTCGYIGSNFWNQGRTQEIKERVLHL